MLATTSPNPNEEKECFPAEYKKPEIMPAEPIRATVQLVSKEIQNPNITDKMIAVAAAYES
ncbi:hypothetical protein GCM10010978_08320 [Compostibacillus humi]|uniref:Uncharacterized protein n=1 Tax=Compostibacillus humi TaxID=1245525 RepID=A0A8J2ZRP7_9BACI|nr:hypothetical protein GCM10010978_08320 [Compostibacillus humi]